MPPKLKYPGEDLLRSLLMVLRPFYLSDEPANFKRVRNMLARHAKARGGDVAKEALTELRAYRDGEKTILSRSAILMQVESSDEKGNTETRTITPGEIFEDYLYALRRTRFSDPCRASIDRLVTPRNSSACALCVRPVGPWHPWRELPRQLRPSQCCRFERPQRLCAPSLRDRPESALRSGLKLQRSFSPRLDSLAFRWARRTEE